MKVYLVSIIRQDGDSYSYLVPQCIKRNLQDALDASCVFVNNEQPINENNTMERATKDNHFTYVLQLGERFKVEMIHNWFGGVLIQTYELQ